MAIKKSELYSSLWSSCDELRGGMDASQYKDYVLAMLFIKYVSDKYADIAFAPIAIPKGASFKDMVALKGKPTIGDDINKKIIAPLENANKLSDLPDFNDVNKLGSGAEMVERLTNLIGIFENPALDFSKNRADGDDILGDAYEYLMRHFATESGKSKGQFYTPAEVSRIMAKIIGISDAKTTNATTVYDPTCGSGSLLLKVGDEARSKLTLYGQEKDVATAGLARMNMILHDQPGAQIIGGYSTLANPLFKDGEGGSERLKTFDYVVANPPFSDKRWSTGLSPLADPYDRFQPFGTPPAKQGDYAYLLHIIRSLKSTGKGACILPHGVLFRGNAEGDIRKNLIRKGYIKGIIGLPANLFYGTGIPACIVVIDKEDAHARKGIFMVDASQGFSKDGPKNRLRAQDIHKIVDAFNKRLDIAKYSRMVSVEEIEKNDFNLNLPRYIDSQEPEDLQDIEGHLKGGIPLADIDALQRYWDICPQLRATLFKPNRKGYVDLAVDKSAIKTTIYTHPEFVAFTTSMNAHFAAWREKHAIELRELKTGIHVKDVIHALAEDLLAHYVGKALMDNYAVYQHLMDYWAETMQDDCYMIAADGWRAETVRVIDTKYGKDGKPSKQIDKGWTCDLVPKALIVARYFAKEQAAINALAEKLENLDTHLTKLQEEHGDEEGAFSEIDKINKANVATRFKVIKAELETCTPRKAALSVSEPPARYWVKGAAACDVDGAVEAEVLRAWMLLNDEITELKRRIKSAEASLDAECYAKYSKLSEKEIKTLVVDDKWLVMLAAKTYGEMGRITKRLADRVDDLRARYEFSLPRAEDQESALDRTVRQNLGRLGFFWEDLKREWSFDQRLQPKFSGEWTIHKLGDVIAHCSSGATPYRGRVDFYKGNVRWISSGELNYNVITDTREKISLEAVERTNLKLHPVGVFLMAITGLEAAGTRGACGIVGAPATTNQSCMAIYPTPELSSKYLYHYYVYRGDELALRYCQGTKQQSYTAKLVKILPIQLPPSVDEQAEIAQVLEEMDLYLAALEAKLRKLRDLKQGMMANLLTGKIRLV